MHRNVGRGQVRFNLTNNLKHCLLIYFPMHCSVKDNRVIQIMFLYIYIFFSHSSRRVYLMKPVKNVIIIYAVMVIINSLNYLLHFVLHGFTLFTFPKFQCYFNRICA